MTSIEGVSLSNFHRRTSFGGISLSNFHRRLSFGGISPSKFVQKHSVGGISPKKFVQKHSVGEISPKKFVQKHSVGEISPKKRLRQPSAGAYGPERRRRKGKRSFGGRGKTVNEKRRPGTRRRTPHVPGTTIQQFNAPKAPTTQQLNINPRQPSPRGCLRGPRRRLGTGRWTMCRRGR